MPSNQEFLSALFGADAPWVHVTSFPHDPNNIPADRHLAAWKGDYFSRYPMQPNTNQYFTISNFYADDTGVARRRKALFRHTPVIVLDDVKEKLSMVEVGKLPDPSWVLETSPGSEQWGYILDTPCTDRSRVENLLDGLVANGLAPEGRDPGMKGVTRYVRLPDGINNKASKLVNGQPFNCTITLWQPFNRVTLEQLAAPFAVNLDAVRRESRVDGAADIGDHPLINIPDIIHIKEVRSDGRFDITCPWVDSHTGADDSGAAIFTNDDGTIGFKCHHGNCQSHTGRDVLRLIEGQVPGFGATFSNWKLMREFSKGAPIAEPSFMAPVVAAPEPSFMAPAAPPQQVAVPDVSVGLNMIVDGLSRVNPGSSEARDMAAQLLKAVEELPQMEKKHWHDITCDKMAWNKSDFKEILKDLRSQWYADSKDNCDFLDNVVFIKEQNQFYDWKSRIFFTPDAFQNSFSHIDADARKTALQEGRVTKVDRLDYAPKQPRVFIDRGLAYGNTWYEGDELPGVQGDVARWLDHWGALGWEPYQQHMLQWIAFTIKHPEQKINHMLLLGSGEGCGKDFLLYPLVKAMGENSLTIAGEELLEGFNDYILSTKHLHINEAELGDRREATAISNKLKPLAAAPPDTLRVNQKGIKPIKVRNILNATMTTNSQLPLRLNGPSRRFFAVWSDMNPRNDYDEMTEEWLTYWEDRWQWMKFGGGAEACIWYLRNCVDLSNFNPAAAPPMTQFLRDITDASKTPAQQTIEAFIERQVGVFRSDLMTSGEAAQSLRNGELAAADIVYCDTKLFTPTRVGLIMKELSKCRQLKANKGDLSIRLWAVRDVEKYAAMTGTQLYNEYERQLQVARKAAPLTIVNP